MNEFFLKKINKYFTILFSYYWCLIYIESFFNIETFIYLLRVIPISLFVIYSLSIFVQLRIFRIPVSLMFLLLFTITCILTSLLRSDINNILSVSLLGFGLFSVFHFKLSIDYRFINKIFIVSALLSVPLYHFGISDYGYIPGLSKTNLQFEFLAGRISMFPTVSLSIYFSLFVFFNNLFLNTRKSKYVFLIISFYFIFYGVSRTSLVVIPIGTILYLLNKYLNLNSIFFSALFIFVFFITVSILLVPELIINSLMGFNIKFINEIFFHNTTNSIDALESFSRYQIWTEHIRLFIENPFGNLSNNTKLFNPNLVSNGGTESFITKILYQYGVGAFFFYVFIIRYFKEALGARDFHGSFFVILFVVIGLTYGSFFTMTNMLFLIFLSMANPKYVQNRGDFL